MCTGARRGGRFRCEDGTTRSWSWRSGVVVAGDVACSSALRRLGVGAVNAGRAELVGVSVLGCPWHPRGRRRGLVPRRVRRGGAWRRRGPGRGRGVSRPRRADDGVAGSGLCAARARSSCSTVRVVGATSGGAQASARRGRGCDGLAAGGADEGGGAMGNGARAAVALVLVGHRLGLRGH